MLAGSGKHPSGQVDDASGWRHVAVTGASSGIGEALARHLAVKGRRLSLAGRDRQRLDAVVAACAAAGADVRGSCVDVTAASEMEAWIGECARARPIDLLIANAGVIDRPGRTPQEVIEVNLLGVVNTIEPAVARMAKGGQLAIMSSILAFRPRPRAPAYAASKVAVQFYAEGIRERLRLAGVEISVVCPGHVATPMHRGRRTPMRSAMSTDQAAEIIIHGLRRRKPWIIFPWARYASARLTALMPRKLIKGGIEYLLGKAGN
jgi:short-subunit dehydrogenase